MIAHIRSGELQNALQLVFKIVPEDAKHKLHSCAKAFDTSFDEKSKIHFMMTETGVKTKEDLRYIFKM